MLDSLVRVSRRVNENHFVRIAKSTNRSTPYSMPLRQPHNFCCPSRLTTQVRDPNPQRGGCLIDTSVQPTVSPCGYKRNRSPAPSARPSPASRTDSDSPRTTGPTHSRSDSPTTRRIAALRQQILPKRVVNMTRGNDWFP